MNSPLDSRQLRAFASLAQTGSFTETARQLRLSQSAISHSIRALEEEVRCRIVNRMGKTVTLTLAGEQLLAHAKRILTEMELARERLSELGKWGHGRLRIGASPTACQYLLPTVVREFKDSFPQCLIQIEPGDTAQTLEFLHEQRIDMALALEPRNDQRIEFRPLFTDELKFLVGPLHPWAKKGFVERGDIVNQRFILYAKKSYLWDMIQEYFRREKIVLPTSIELGNVEAIKELVKLGLGISILARWVAEKELADGSLVALPLGRRKLRRRWGILLRADQRLTLAQETFVGLCEAAAENLDLHGEPEPASGASPAV